MVLHCLPQAKFDELLPKYRVRPTALIPLWNIAGYALGMGTALMGKEAAMACTVAVEDSIGTHYSDQLRSLLEDASRYPDDPGEVKLLLLLLFFCFFFFFFFFLPW